MFKWNKITIHYLLRLVLFWFLYFALFRLAFIVYHHAKIDDGQHSQTSMSFLYALRLDLATICAIVFIPCILWTFQQFYKSRLIHRINKTFNIILISIISLLSIFNIKIYGEYGRILIFEDLNYLIHPDKTVTFLSIWSLILLLGAASFFAYIGIRSYDRHINNFSLPFENKYCKIAQVVIFPIILFIGLRGGYQSIPISEKNSYYSNLQINNDIATNNIWFLGNSILHGNVEQLKRADK